MSETQQAPEAGPEVLSLRARPKPVTRINRRVLILLAGTGMLLILGATLVALDPPALIKRDGDGAELYRPRTAPVPEGIDALPQRYSDLPDAETPEVIAEPPPPAAIPPLGPPLPGDLGNAVVATEQDLGLGPDLPFRPDPVDDAARADRIRQARLAQQGRESGLFFQLSSPIGVAVPEAVGTNGALLNGGSVTGANASAARGPGMPIDPDADPNGQARKLAFLAERPDPDIYNPYGLQGPASPYQVMAGTLIPASLVTGLNADLPGQVIAQVTENVFDTVTGRHLLIPQGTRLLGRYDSVITFGQERALVVWQRLIRPDGSSILIDNWPATDTAGYAGLEDQVDIHTWSLLRGIGLSSLLSIGAELTLGPDESDLVRAFREATQSNVTQVGQDLTDRLLNRQPTITIRPGWPLRIIVNKDLILSPYSP